MLCVLPATENEPWKGEENEYRAQFSSSFSRSERVSHQGTVAAGRARNSVRVSTFEK